MDVFAHAAWGATIIRKEPHVWWAALFGSLPDVIPAVYGFFKFKRGYTKILTEMGDNMHEGNPYFNVYRYTHSLVPITVVTIILYFVIPDYWFVTLPYYLHIFMDVFTHQKVWATRLFYPLSDFHIEGWNWWHNKWISLGNWIALIVINFLFFLS